MNFAFLRQLPGLGRRPLHRIVADGALAAGAETAIQHLVAELPELLLAAVVVVEPAQVVAAYTSQPQLWPGPAAPLWAALVQQLRAGQVAQGQHEEQVQEVLITLQAQLHLLRLRPDGQQLLYLAVESQDTNLALAREVMRQAIEILITS